LLKPALNWRSRRAEGLVMAGSYGLWRSDKGVIAGNAELSNWG
jgi:hypothetical protein